MASKDVWSGLAETYKKWELEEESPYGRLVKAAKRVPGYLVGKIPGTIPGVIRGSLEQLPEVMYKPGHTGGGAILDRPMLALDLAGMMSPGILRAKTAGKSTLGIFGGKGAKVKSKEGWIKNPYDKKWRFEIDDSKMKYTPEAKKFFDSGSAEFRFEDGVKVGDLVSHPDLFKAYPEMAKTPVSMKIVSEMDKLTGTYKEGGLFSEHGIVIHAKNHKQAKKTLIHEIQHAVQKIEGFARGGSPKSMFLLDPRFQGIKKKYEKQALETWKKEHPGATDIPYSIRGEAVEKAKHEAYLNLAGEIEAREAAGRMGLTAQQRGKLVPYKDAIKPEEAIIRYK